MHKNYNMHGDSAKVRLEIRLLALAPSSERHVAFHRPAAVPLFIVLMRTATSFLLSATKLSRMC